MATTNPFDLLGDDDNDDLSVLIASAAVIKKSSDPATAASAAPPAKPAKLPTKPPPPAQAVRDAKTEASRGGGHGRGRGNGQGRGGGGFNRNSIGGDNTVGSDNGFPLSSKYSEDRESGRPFERRGGYGSPRGGFRGGRRGGFSDGHSGEGERPRRVYERRSGTGRGDEIKRDGAGRGNWGTATDEIPQENEEPAGETDAAVAAEEKVVEEENVEAEKENPVNEPEEKEPEEKQMTLEEYVKVLEEKRKALLVLKTEERKVDVDKEFESMHLVSKKGDDAIFIKLGSEKDKRKDAAEKEERAKKAVSINEFLKPAAGETYYRAGGRGRGRGGRGSREGFGGSNGTNNASAPSIEDPGQFPSLGGAK